MFQRMSAFTPGNITDLTREGEAEPGWRTSEELQQPGREERPRKVGRERDTGDEGGPEARAAGRGISDRPRRPWLNERPENPRRHGGNKAPDTGEPRACKGKGCKKPTTTNRKDNTKKNTADKQAQTTEYQAETSETQAATPKAETVIPEAKPEAQETNPEAKSKLIPGWDETDPTVPKGWETRIFSNGPNKTMKKLKDPSGVIIQTRKEAQQRMLVSNVYAQKDVNHMKSHLNSQSKNKIYRNVAKEDPRQEVVRTETQINKMLMNGSKREFKQEVIKEEAPKDEDEMMQEAEEWGKEIEEKVVKSERYSEKELQKKD